MTNFSSLGTILSLWFIYLVALKMWFEVMEKKRNRSLSVMKSYRLSNIRVYRFEFVEHDAKEIVLLWTIQ